MCLSRRWICQWLLIHYLNWSDVSVRATVTLNAVVANGMSLNVPVHVANVKDSVKIATLMQAPVIQVNTNFYDIMNYIIASRTTSW